MKQRYWALAAIPAVAFALMASSFRYVEIYTPNNLTSPVKADIGGEAHLVQDSEVDGVPNHIDVTAVLTDLNRVSSDQEPIMDPESPIDLWQATIDFRAASDIPLIGCRPTLIDAHGTAYLPAHQVFNKVDVIGVLDSADCVPQEAPGPYFDTALNSPDLQEDDLFDEPAQRPGTWTSRLWFILPEGAKPAELRISWMPPDYISFTPLEVTGPEVRVSASAPF